jgi:hypothetical protein
MLICSHSQAKLGQRPGRGNCTKFFKRVVADGDMHQLAADKTSQIKDLKELRL